MEDYVAKHKFPWGAFITSFKHIVTYHAHVSEISAHGTKPTPKAAITLTFDSQYMAKIFLYWITILGGVNAYEGAVYLEDALPEIYEGVE